MFSIVRLFTLARRVSSSSSRVYSLSLSIACCLPLTQITLYRSFHFLHSGKSHCDFFKRKVRNHHGTNLGPIACCCCVLKAHQNGFGIGRGIHVKYKGRLTRVVCHVLQCKGDKGSRLLEKVGTDSDQGILSCRDEWIRVASYCLGLRVVLDNDVDAICEHCGLGR